ncbi:DUF2510 domain-containing protein [Nocardia sienata]|uniref:DUF2510 domain-containing protein n=1 Tax=Nocardia sienata TaxID=248552 RepID=UPI000A8F74D6|nr:DUF2510 domain-containing protein [Nocardia sienata]
MDDQQQHENIARQRRTTRNILVVAGIGLVAFVLLGIIGYLIGDDTATEETAPAGATTEVAPAPVAPPPAEQNNSPATTPETSTIESSAPPAASPPPAATPVYSDPRCAPASAELVALVAAGLTTDGHELANGTVIEENGTTYFGATTLDAVGDMDARSDVWIVRDGAVYSSTGGARNQTSFPRASDELGISPGDPIVLAVDNCVIDLTS